MYDVVTGVTLLAVIMVLIDQLAGLTTSLTMENWRWWLGTPGGMALFGVMTILSFAFVAEKSSFPSAVKGLAIVATAGMVLWIGWIMIVSGF